MDKPKLILIAFTLLSIGFIEIFLVWYKSFLRKRATNEKMIMQLHRLTFAILSFIFWRSFATPAGEGDFFSTHFYFTLFIFSLYRLVSSFIKAKKTTEE